MSPTKDLRVIRYTIELKSPLLTTHVQGEPNGAVSAPFIPGSLLRGALVGAYLSENPKTEFDANESLARALFFSDKTRFLHAYPVKKLPREKIDVRALPTPIAWRHNKDDRYAEGDVSRTVYDFSRDAFPYPDKGVSKEFCWWNDDDQNASLFTPPRQLNVHTQRDARKGRPTVKRNGEGEQTIGTIYRYDALAAGLQMKAVILTAEEYAKTIENLLPAGRTIWIGRARRAGYGRAEIINVEPLADYWREDDSDQRPRTVSAGDGLRITFTSDVLLRSQYGQSSLDPCAAIAEALGIDSGDLALLGKYTWAETRIIGGFNRKWGMPLPQAVAIAAGSVFAYQTSVSISADSLETLEQRGIGERRNEGFGRLIVNWLEHSDRSFESGEFRPDTVPPKLQNLDPAEERIVKALARRILRGKLNEELLRRINSTNLKSPPQKNQIARLRVTLRAVQARREPGHADIEQLEDYLNDLQKRRTARNQFEKAMVDESGILTPLLRWIGDQLADPKKNWPCEVILGEGDVEMKFETDDALALEHTLRLIDRVLYRATKE